jgi:molybdopterin molybdotransferase
MFLPRDAEQTILGQLGTGPRIEHVDLRAARGRVLAADIYTDTDQPPFDRVAMDGIALRSTAYAAGLRRFRVAHTQGAGCEPRPLGADDDCIEIMTGAALPAGADAVIPVERLSLEAGIATVADDLAVVPGLNIHRRGLDQAAGTRVLAAGTRLRAPEVAILAAAGAARVAVGRRPRIAVVSTGDELVEPGTVPLPWQVRRSNVYAILAALSARGHREAVDLHLPDDLPLLTARLGEVLASHDVVVLSGGVSAGRFDYVPAALEANGVSKVFHKVAQRPGRPLWFGRGSGGQLVFGLPGNPVSTLTCLVRYVLPALNAFEGAPPEAPSRLALDGRIQAPPGLAFFMPVDLDSGPTGSRAVPHPTHGSGDFSSLARTAGFVEIGPGETAEHGATVPIYHW